MLIKDIASENRPRERLLRHGAMALSNSELLAILLNNGTKRNNIITLANKILKENTLLCLSNKQVHELKRIKGIGSVKACQIVACFELAKRLASFKENPQQRLDSADDVFRLFKNRIRNLKKEHFKCLYINSRNCLIKEETISIGTLDMSIVHPREIFQPAIALSAAAVILLHNHPSGDPSPSDDDINITKQMISAGEILGITVLDHVIIGSNFYFSFKEKNLCFT